MKRFSNIQIKLHTADKVKDIKMDEIRNIINLQSSLDDNNMPNGYEFYSDQVVIIRPSGNPLSKQGWYDMMNSADITIKQLKVLDIHKIDVVGDMAYAVFTEHSTFNYKGTQNDDISVFSKVFQKIDGQWKTVLVQRSSGRSPADKLPEF